MQLHIINAFTQSGAGGNPAAVVINEQLTESEKQSIARRAGLSETAFVTATANELFIEFFTPEKPIAYCGHATIGSVNILYEKNLIGEGNFILKTKLDPIPVSINGDKAYMQQAYPDFETVSMDEAAILLNISNRHIRHTIIANNGVKFLLIELSDDQILFHLNPDQELIYNFSKKQDLIGVYVYVVNNNKILSRMFAPYYGIKEENATGMAAGLLGGLLHHQSQGKVTELYIEQGYSPTMNEHGYLHVLINGQHALVGGEAVIKETKSL